MRRCGLNDHSEFNRLRWQCRRGMLELDLLLLGFLESDYSGLDAELRRDFGRLLGYPDPRLQSWLLEAPDLDAVVAPLRTIVARIRRGGRDAPLL